MPNHTSDNDSTDAHSSIKPLLITTGEPAGIGMDIVIDVLCHHGDELGGSVLILADKVAFFERAAQLGMDKHTALTSMVVLDDLQTDQLDGDNLSHHLKASFDNHSKPTVYLMHIPCTDTVIASQLNPNNAKMVERQLSVAHRLASDGVVRAIITAPLQKSVMIDGGVQLDNGDLFSGHTEYFMHKAGCDKVVMMLANQAMKVALVTTHLPLRAVADAITTDEVASTVAITHHALKAQFGIPNPTILVCGLNPHAGESGHLGDEEMRIINPVLQQFRDDGMDISLAMPADTLFTRHHLSRCDAVIAMYHDQGLSPLKSHGFGDAVNITLGLPYVRTSVDHGTALDLAGTGQASSSSLLQAIAYALMMS
ncbi:4-hydroxythreonine-4-phosphate dehydrogenase PdxA [Moraxella pluranimalium]|uniref:4-hydroxythreonine-4-phosphate dehydrogenase PdxA n=1 Tax=Moraxella pluranimalium TaxID=470453 RepID=A0A1T0CUI0_9GAMM|nr:4-hydroxythreonine-4-phosphate dehydrogenase PdxA [Moraxella pluranimalium]OOS26015.1 4-hydroxythreonine-4-phosphate dehydrogenase PdxA [Moraxella pluranimalium]